MEGNRDESERCIKLAEDYIERGLNDKAKKFLHKAERLYPSKQAKGTNTVGYLVYFGGTLNLALIIHS